MMKRYACHRVYTSPKHYLNQAYITLDEQGEVVNYATFTEEVSATEWIGGVIFLSDTTPAPTDDFQAWAKKHIKNEGIPTYAWHLSEFNFEREEPTPTCIFRRL